MINRAGLPFKTILAGLFALSMSPAAAGDLIDIKFCNNYSDPIYVAIAYPQSSGGWVSRGWLEVPTGDCSFFDTALHLPMFYLRGQTEWYASGRRRRTREIWGGRGERSFAVVESSGGSFNYYTAEVHARGIPNEPFLKFFGDGQLNLDNDMRATVTFNADGTVASNVAPLQPVVTAPVAPPIAPPNADSMTAK